MTREELRDYVDEQRTLNNIPYHVYSALIDGIDTLEQEPIEPVLEDIKADIKKEVANIKRDKYSQRQNDYCDGFAFAMGMSLGIIEKHIISRK